MSAPGGALPPPIPTSAELAVMLAQVMNSVGLLTTQVQDLATEVANLAAMHTRSGATSKDAVACPKPWDGKSGSAEARHFLAAFHNWAFGQGDSLNTGIPAACYALAGAVHKFKDCSYKVPSESVYCFTTRKY
jgi:hypothetical protein